MNIWKSDKGGAVRLRLQRARRLVIVAVTMLVATAGFGGVASADSHGGVTWGKYCAWKTCAPEGYFDVYFKSYGKTPEFADAKWRSGPPVCNWWIDFDHYTVANSNGGPAYAHYQGETEYGCDNLGKTAVTYKEVTSKYDWQPGTVCATLYSNAKKLARKCLSVDDRYDANDKARERASSRGLT